MGYLTIVPTSLPFLHLFHNLCSTSKDSREESLSFYILELSLLSPRLLKYSDSVAALASLYLSRKILQLDCDIIASLKDFNI